MQKDIYYFNNLYHRPNNRSKDKWFSRASWKWRLVNDSDVGRTYNQKHLLIVLKLF